jgi:hypothetical protein
MSMSNSATKKLVLGTMVGAIAVIGALTPAFARSGHHGHHRHIFRAPIVVTPSHLGSCDYYYWKWKRTGSTYWRSQYFSCIR